MDDVSCGGAIEFFGDQTEFGLGQADIVGADGFADFADLRTDCPFDRPIVGSPHDVLPQSLCCTIGIWHVLAVFSSVHEWGVREDGYGAIFPWESLIVTDFGDLV